MRIGVKDFDLIFYLMQVEVGSNVTKLILALFLSLSKGRSILCRVEL